MSSLGLVQGVGTLVLFSHSVDDEHDKEDGAEEADHRAPDHGGEDAGLGEEGDGPVERGEVGLA